MLIRALATFEVAFDPKRKLMLGAGELADVPFSVGQEAVARGAAVEILPEPEPAPELQPPEPTPEPEPPAEPAPAFTLTVLEPAAPASANDPSDDPTGELAAAGYRGAEED